MIREVDPSDAAAICRIYNEYVKNSTATFEESVVSTSEMVARIETITADYPWFVFEEAGTVVGYTYARKWRDRASYRRTAETGTYLDHGFTGRGLGTALKATLIDEMKTRAFHTLISGIALPNPASVALCERFGFHKVAHFKEVGYKLGRWIDVGCWQLVL